MKLLSAVALTAKNTLILQYFLVWKFCGKAQLLLSFGQFARNSAQTVPFQQIFTPGNLVILRFFTQCLNERKLVFFGKKASPLFLFSHERIVQLGPENGVCYKEMSD